MIGCERLLLLLGVVLVVFLFLRQVFLDLPDVGADVRRAERRRRRC